MTYRTVDLPAMSMRQLRELKQAQMDVAWREKYPNGLFTLEITKAGEKQLLHFNRRPTSRTRYGVTFAHTWEKVYDRLESPQPEWGWFPVGSIKRIKRGDIESFSKLCVKYNVPEEVLANFKERLRKKGRLPQ